MSSALIESVAVFSNDIKRTFKSQNSTIELQNRKIQELSGQVQILTDCLERLQSVVKQVIGGIFNSNTQREIIDLHFDIIENREENTDFVCGSEWGSYPTTRQGDELEVMMEKMKEEHEKMKEEHEKMKEEHEKMKMQHKEKTNELLARIEILEVQNIERDEYMMKDLIQKMKKLQI